MLRTESTPAAQSGSTAPSASPVPPHDDIARRAYEVYVESGSRQGHCRENWERAERELRQQAEASHSPDHSAAISAQDDDYEPVARTFPEAIGSMQRDHAAAHGVSPRGPHGNRDAIP